MKLEQYLKVFEDEESHATIEFPWEEYLAQDDYLVHESEEGLILVFCHGEVEIENFYEQMKKKAKELNLTLSPINSGLQRTEMQRYVSYRAKKITNICRVNIISQPCRTLSGLLDFWDKKLTYPPRIIYWSKHMKKKGGS